jgi:hypothetical protein
MKIQAWGWLTAGVLALGLNGFYQDGGFAWAHQVASKIEHNANAVLALASGHTDNFLAEARFLTSDTSDPSCQWQRQLQRVQTRVAVMQARAQARSDEGAARFEVMSARQQAQLARLQASRERMQAELEAQRDRWQAEFNQANFKPVRFESVEIPAAEFGSSDCRALRVKVPHVHVRVPQPPRVQVEVPQIHIDVNGAGPI